MGARYDNDFRIKKAGEWRQAAVDRKSHAEGQMEHDWEGKPDAWWAAMQNISDFCSDRIQVIDALFPELRQ